MIIGVAIHNLDTSFFNNAYIMISVPAIPRLDDFFYLNEIDIERLKGQIRKVEHYEELYDEYYMSHREDNLSNLGSAINVVSVGYEYKKGYDEYTPIIELSYSTRKEIDEYYASI
jgi:hypothetical protein